MTPGMCPGESPIETSSPLRVRLDSGRRSNLTIIYT